MDLIRNIINFADLKNASVLILSVDMVPVIRYEEGLLETDFPKLNIENLEKFIQSILTNNQIIKLREEMSFKTSFSLNDKRVKASVSYDKKGITVIMKFIRDFSSEKLNIADYDLFLENIEKRSGLFVVSGLPGTGKTNCCYRILREISNEKNYHFVTLENPIELKLEFKKGFIQQREIGKHCKSYSEGIDYAVTSGADVLYIDRLEGSEGFSQLISAINSKILVILNYPSPDLTSLFFTLPGKFSIGGDFFQQYAFFTDYILKGIFFNTNIKGFFNTEIIFNPCKFKEIVVNFSRGKSSALEEEKNEKEKFIEPVKTTRIAENKTKLKEKNDFQTFKNDVQEPPIIQKLKDFSKPEEDLEHMIDNILEVPLRPSK